MITYQTTNTQEKIKQLYFVYEFVQITDAEITLYTPLVKYYNDLLGRQSCERNRKEVTYISVGDHFCVHLGTKYGKFQEQIFAEKKCQNVSLL